MYTITRIESSDRTPLWKAELTHQGGQERRGFQFIGEAKQWLIDNAFAFNNDTKLFIEIIDHTGLDPLVIDDKILVNLHKPVQKTDIQGSLYCACYYCSKLFFPESIEDWVDKDQKTPLCPYCAIDAVIGCNNINLCSVVEPVALSKNLLQNMYKKWFEPKPPPLELSVEEYKAVVGMREGKLKVSPTTQADKLRAEAKNLVKIIIDWFSQKFEYDVIQNELKESWTFSFYKNASKVTGTTLTVIKSSPYDDFGAKNTYVLTQHSPELEMFAKLMLAVLPLTEENQ